MCRFKSAIIFKNRVVLAPTYNDSHSDILERLGVEDNTLNATKMFVRAELIPPHNNKAEKVSEWRFHVDQDITPDWFDEDRGKYEEEMRGAVQAWADDHVLTAAGETWIAIKEDEKGTYYLLDRVLPSMEFGSTNNYKESNIRKYLAESDLTKKLKDEFGDRLASISLNLKSLDGLDDYGTCEGDILGIPTLDLYRECRKEIPSATNWWWLSTPDSTPSGWSASNVLCVSGGGRVDYSGCRSGRALRPFFILKS